MADQEVDLDSIIDRLLEVRGSRPGKQVQLLESEIRYLCTKAREIFISQPILLELEAPIKVRVLCLWSLDHNFFFSLCLSPTRVSNVSCFDHRSAVISTVNTTISSVCLNTAVSPEANYLFLGDYVDRGKQSLETICLLLAYKIKYPENFFILRGNHECASINRIYGFYDECKRRYNIKLWKTFTDCFNCLPIAAIIDEKIFTMHGGLSPDLNSMEQIRRVMRPTDVSFSSTIFESLLDTDSSAGVLLFYARTRELAGTLYTKNCGASGGLKAKLTNIYDNRSPTVASFAIFCGLTRTRISRVGARTTVVSLSHSAPTWYRASSRNTTWI